MKPAPFEFVACHSPGEAIAALAAAGDAAKVCGGTQSLGPMLNLRLAQVEQLVDLSRLDALRAFALDADVLRIGAAVTHARIEDGELPDVTRGLLPMVAAGIAYRAVRNRGTLGGSLAHADPAADWVTTMSLLDAHVVLLGAGGERRLHASAFFDGPFTTALGATELIAAVEVPRFSGKARWAYRKSCRKPGEFAEAIAALWLDPERDISRAALGALDRMPHVVDGAEAVQALRDGGAVAALFDALGVDDDYQRQLHAAMLRRAFTDLDAFAP